MKILLTLSVLIISLSSALVLAADPVQERKQEREQTQLQDQNEAYGSQFMTQQERVEHQAQMRSAKTTEERARIRAEHHERMKKRAKEQGAILPGEPRALGKGMKPGGGKGGYGR